MKATHLGSYGHTATWDTGLGNVQNKLKLVIPRLRQLAAQPSPCGICGGQSGTETGFYSSTSGFPCQYHSPIAPYLLIHLLLAIDSIIKQHN